MAWSYFITLWAWVCAVATHQPAYITADGKHIIRRRKEGYIYITPVPKSNPLYLNNFPIRRHRHWLGEDAVGRFIQDEYVYCPEGQGRIMGSRKATRGCYVEGGGYKGYVVEEIGPYWTHRTLGSPTLECESFHPPSYKPTDSAEDMKNRSITYGNPGS